MVCAKLLQSFVITWPFQVFASLMRSAITGIQSVLPSKLICVVRTQVKLHGLNGFMRLDYVVRLEDIVKNSVSGG